MPNLRNLQNLRSDPLPTRNNMKLLTYNIHYWQGTDGVIDVERAIEVIGASDADIIGLNEVYHPALLQGLDAPALEYMAERLDMTFVYGQAQGFDLAFDRPGRSFGNALLSRWPILASAGHHLPPAPGHAPRGLLEGRVLLPDRRRTLTVYVTHIDPSDEDVRLAQIQALLTWTVRDRNRAHVLMGDLNTYSPEDFGGFGSKAALQAAVDALGWEMYAPKVMTRLLKSGYVDAWMRCESAPAATYEAPDARFRIDYVLLSESLAPHLRSCRRIDAAPAALASDHYPVLIELDY